MKEIHFEKNIMIVNQGLKDINPLLCGEEKCLPSHAFGPTIREYYLIHYVLSGKGYFETKGKRQVISKGQIFIIRPFEVTYYQADDKEPWHYCWLGFESHVDIESILEQDVIAIPECEHIFQSIRKCDHMEVGKELYICGKIYELLSRLKEQQSSYKPHAYEYILKARNYIEVNYMKPISVELIAKMLGLDRSYFSKMFKDYIGKSPQCYLVDFRLEKAAELMVTYGYKPREAALSTGYTDIYNFSKMFKQKFGISPREYKNKDR